MKTFKDLMIQETLDAMQENKDNLYNNPFRLGSEMFFHTIKEARRLHLEGKYIPTAVDKNILETDLGEYEVYENELVPLDCPMMNISEEEKKELNKPKRGGPKKFYVFVKDGDKIKKVTFGDTTGLSVKFDDTKARSSYVARHNCDTANDKTKPSYWSCRLPYYAKQLGLSGGGSFFW